MAVRFMRERGMTVPNELLPGPVRVAVIDDDRRHVEAVVDTLGELAPSLDIRTAPDGFAAGLLLGSFRPDLVLLDLVMPGLDGFEVLRRLREQPELEGTTVVVISGELSPERIRRCLELGAARCLTKPLSEDDLGAVLTAYLPAERPVERP